MLPHPPPQEKRKKKTCSEDHNGYNVTLKY